MEGKLWNYKRERDIHENFADLFAIIKATEKLEKAYVRYIVSPTGYEPECQKLIAQFKTLTSPDTNKICLMTTGVRATVEHRAAAAKSATTSAPIVAECVQNFITAMESSMLNMVAID